MVETYESEHNARKRKARRDVIRDACLSACGTWRYWLSREELNAPRGCVLWVMLNPSTADASRDDPTIRRCQSFTKGWGLGRMVVVNLFALRATDSDVLRAAGSRRLGPGNDGFIRSRIKREEPKYIVAAWGTGGGLMDRDRQVLDLIRDCGRQPWALGVTKAGFPRHPLYMPATATLSVYAGRTD